jgi:ketosteroid isomerase-like protein
MARGNVEAVETAIEAFNRRDLSALADLSDDDLEIVSVLTAANLGGATYRRSEAWTAYFAAMDEAWQEWQLEDFRLLDGGDDHVVCLCRMVGMGKQSGVPVERPTGIVFRFRRARLWRIRSYLDPEDALEAVGLRE